MNFIAPRVADSAQAAANLSLSTMSAQTVLAEDTIFGTVMDIKSGKGTTALFSNPINGGKEEMLYIDSLNDLYWVRHSNGQYSSPGSEANPSWSVELVANGYSSVVVAVHPDGTVWAFAISTLSGLGVRAFYLQSSPTAAAGATWEAKTVGPYLRSATQLSVFYSGPWPTSPAIMMIDKDLSMYAYYPIPAADGVMADWNGLVVFKINTDDFKNLGCMGAALFPTAAPYGNKSIPGLYYVYTLDQTGLLKLFTGQTEGNPYGTNVVGTGFTAIVGACNTPTGPGCIAIREQTGTDQKLAFICPDATAPFGKQFYETEMLMDQPLDDLQVWQDAKGMMHVYGRGADGGLYVIHQLSWNGTDKTVNQTGLMEPEWDYHMTRTGLAVITSRAVIANVASYNLDCYPDEMPNQHVMHAGVAAGEMCAFYTQGLGDGYWAKEKVRLAPPEGTAPYLVKRYQTVVTVKDGFGSPSGGVNLIVRASAPVDLQVNGLFYRPGPNTPLELSTDGAGRVILRVMAEGLYQPTLYVTGTGITDSLSIAPTASIQKYLGGNGTLPDRPGAFDADTVTNAKKPDGTYLFPNIDRSGKGLKDDEFKPKPEELVSWCQSAFATQAHGKLMVDDPRKSGAKIQARAISFQVHDRTRPAYQEHTNQLIVAGHEQRLSALQYGDGASEFVGDIWAGIRGGLIEVKEYWVNLETLAYKVYVVLKDATGAVFEGFYHTAQQAGQAIEAAFVAVKAVVIPVIDYLSWLFQFKDVWLAKKALESGFQQTLPWVLKMIKWCRDNGDGWFIGKEKDVEAAFAAMKEACTGKTFASLQAPAGASGPTPVAATKMHELVGSGHAYWVNDNFHQSMQTPAAWKHKPGPEDNPFDKIMDDIKNSPAWAEIGPIFTDVGNLFTNLFSGDDAGTLLSREIYTIIDLFEHLTLAALKVGNTIFDIVLDFIAAMVTTAYDYLNEEIDIPLLQTVYDFIQEQAGVDEKDYEKLTTLHMGILMPAFIGTITYKAVFQAAPFPDGTFPNIFPKEGKLPAPQDDKPGVIWPDGWLSGLVACQFYGSAMMVADAYFDAGLNITTAKLVGDYPPVYYKVWAFNHMIAYGVLDMPLVWGNRFPKDHYDETVGTILPTLMWIISFFMNGIDVACAWRYGYFVTRYEEDSNGMGAQVFAMGGLTRMIMSGVRYQYGPDYGSRVARLNMMINVTSFFSATTGFVRFLYKKNPEVFVIPLVMKCGLDVICDLFAGIASVFEVVWEYNKPPKIIEPGEVLKGSVGKTFNYAIDGQDGLQPYSWEVVIPSEETSDVKGLPPGIILDNVQTESVLLHGKPTTAGTYVFQLKLGDDYGPSVYYLSNIITFEVIPPK